VETLEREVLVASGGWVWVDTEELDIVVDSLVLETVVVVVILEVSWTVRVLVLSSDEVDCSAIIVVEVSVGGVLDVEAAAPADEPKLLDDSLVSFVVGTVVELVPEEAVVDIEAGLVSVVELGGSVSISIGGGIG